jgi:hypothetical protein
MWLLDKLAEQHIQEAANRGEFDDLDGAGKRLQIEEPNPFIPEELRSAYRLLSNSGYLPDEVRLRKEINEAEQLLLTAQDETLKQEASARLRLLLSRLGSSRTSSLATEQAYYQQLSRRLARNG